MNKYPIYQATGTPTGAVGSVRTNIRVPDNTAQYAAMGHFGAALSALGTTVWMMQGEVELAKAQAADSDDLYKMFANFEKTDPDTYKQQFADVMAGIKAREVKNGWAARRRNIALEKNTPLWDAKMMEAASKKTEDMYNSELALKLARAEETGNLTEARTTLKRGVDNGWLDEYQVEQKLMTTERLAKRRQLVASMQDDPDAYIDLINQGWDAFHEKNPEQIPEDLPYFYGVAVAHKARQKMAIVEGQRQAETKLWDFLADPKTEPTDLFDYVDKLPPELYPTLEDRDRLLRQMTSIYDRRSKGQDTLVERQSQETYWELMQQAVDKKTNEPKIRAAVNAGKISTSDYIYLNSILKQNSAEGIAARDFVSVSRTMGKLIDSSDTIYVDKEVAKLRGQRLLEDRMRDAESRGNPLTGRDLEDEMLRTYVQLQDEDSSEAWTSPTSYLGVPSTRFPYEPPFAFGVLDSDGSLLLSEDDKQRVAQWAKANGWSLEELKAYLKTKGAKL